MKKWFSLILIVLLTGIVSCIRQTLPVPPNDPFEGNILLTTWIGLGSQFVYRDSLTGEIDSLEVSTNEFRRFDPYPDDSNQTTIEIAWLDLLNKNKPFDQSYFELSFNAWSPGNTLNVMADINIPGLKMRYGVRAFEDEFVTRAAAPKAVNQATDVHEFLTLNGVAYGTVYENIFMYTDTANHDFFQSWFSPASGLIKFRLREGNNFIVKELVYSEIIRKN